MDAGWLDKFSQLYLPDENSVVETLLSRTVLHPNQLKQIALDAEALVNNVRARPEHFTPLERFLSEYSLGTTEGVLLMCLAETLLRIPDKANAIHFFNFSAAKKLMTRKANIKLI